MSDTKKTTLNAHGVKDAADMWRTFNGEHYIQWMSFPPDERIKGYRAAGIKCRRVGEELFVRQSDKDKALAYDAENPEPYI
jgi:hypothetical protein